MKPILFPQVTNILMPPSRKYSENIGKIIELPTWSDGEQVVSCWKMSWKDRLHALLFGRVWVSILTGDDTQPPISVSVERSYFQEIP